MLAGMLLSQLYGLMEDFSFNTVKAVFGRKKTGRQNMA
jgi:hypothetical protein